MAEEKPPQRSRRELAIKVLTPIAAGLLIALAGILGEGILERMSIRAERARLVAELQVNREMAESELRKDVFDKTLSTFLSDKVDDSCIRGLTNQLLRLELLALNFGDSLNLSPLFTELKRDLDSAEPLDIDDAIDHPERIAVLRKRLQGLAKRVASSQLSSLEQHGKSFNVRVPLPDLTDSTPCHQLLYDRDNYIWPEHEVDLIFGDVGGDPVLKEKRLEAIDERGKIVVGGVRREFTLTFAQVDHCSKTAKVDIRITRISEDGSEADPVKEDFRLDYFNFPKIDNTRLSDNQRFAIVMESFDITDEPQIKISGVIFPAEYASLRDRPGMQEALDLLEQAYGPEESSKWKEGFP